MKILNIASIELVKLTPAWQAGLKLFFQSLNSEGDRQYFSPHPTDEKSINQIASTSGRDLYYLLVEDEKVLGYGLLRGWDEGYTIPSLGVAIHPLARGAGLGRMLIHFLHTLAHLRGARKVRLRVHQNNHKAISLYKSIGYVFEENVNQDVYLVGFKDIKRESGNEM